MADTARYFHAAYTLVALWFVGYCVSLTARVRRVRRRRARLVTRPEAAGE